MPMSEARKRANQKWNEANMNVKYDHIHLTVPKGMKDQIAEAARKEGISSNAFIKTAIEKRLGTEE
jgi:predicted HicB family RNase H-like nuclease